MKEIKINEFDPAFIDEFNKKLDSLIPNNSLSPNFQKLIEINDLIKQFKKYKDTKKIRLLFIGKISSGKTSLLNSIIGDNLNILESNMSECTKTNFIIKNGMKYL